MRVIALRAADAVRIAAPLLALLLALSCSGSSAGGTQASATCLVVDPDCAPCTENACATEFSAAADACMAWMCDSVHAPLTRVSPSCSV